MPEIAVEYEQLSLEHLIIFLLVLFFPLWLLLSGVRVPIDVNVSSSVGVCGRSGWWVVWWDGGARGLSGRRGVSQSNAGVTVRSSSLLGNGSTVVRETSSQIDVSSIKMELPTRADRQEFVTISTRICYRIYRLVKNLLHLGCRHISDLRSLKRNFKSNTSFDFDVWGYFLTYWYMFTPTNSIMITEHQWISHMYLILR